jgi:ubiquinone/menaquinone biosynthesis C-methylase UbiE
MDYTQILKCPEQKCTGTGDSALGKLVLTKCKFNKDVLVSGVFRCSTCDAIYHMKNGILNLIPDRILKYAEGKSSRTPLSEYDRMIASGIDWNKRMVPSYHENVVDQFTSARGARETERYEDLFVDSVLDHSVKTQNQKTIFLEMGAGTGRYVIRYGARIVNTHKNGNRRFYRASVHQHKSRACQDYRQDSVLGRYYSHDEDYDENLQLLIGVDFQEGMIKKCIDVIRAKRLGDLLGRRVLLFVAAGQYFNMIFGNVPEYRNSYKIVACLFQTLGNQRRNQQIDLLKTMKRLAHPHGKVIVSVFNSAEFREFGLKKFYKDDVWPTVGNIREDPEALKLRDENILLTDKGVYSKWFEKDELQELFAAAGMHARIKQNQDLPDFADHKEYLTKTIQREVKRRMMIAEAEL